MLQKVINVANVKEFSVNNDLTRHMLCVHSGETRVHKGKQKVHKCKECGKKFFVQNDLKRHVLCDIHHKCKECGKLFSMKFFLKKHIIYAHKKRNVHESKNDLNYDESCKCILCGKLFDDKIALKRHTSNFHEGRYKCDICDYCFKNPVLLNVHVLKNHKRIKNEPS